MSTPATTTPDIQSPDSAKIKNTAILFLCIGCLILPIGIVNFVHAMPYCFAAPFFCIALAIVLFTRKPKAILYIFVANLVLEIPRLIYHFWDCFQCEYLVKDSWSEKEVGYYLPDYHLELDELRLATCILLTVSCFLLIVSTICAITYLCAQKRETILYSNSAVWSIFLVALSYIVSEVAYIVQLVNTVDYGSNYYIPIDIIIVALNAVIGIMMTKSIYNLFCILPGIEQLVKDDAAKRATQSPYTSGPAPVPVTPTPSYTPVNVADEIMKYKQLLDMGAITQEEYDQKKTELLHINN